MSSAEAIGAPACARSRIPANKGKTYDPHLYTVEEIVALMKACAATSKYAGRTQWLAGARNRAAIAVLWRSGLRISELLALEMRDLLIEERFIVVRHGGKNGRRREVPMDKFGWDELARWLELRRELPSGTVFCVVGRRDRMGEQLSPDSFRDALHALGVRAGLDRRCTPHNFRHTFAGELLVEGDVDMYTISKILGHVDARVTEIYFRALPLRRLMRPVTERRAPVLAITASL